jgi:PAS domain S-box-containing protein
MVQLDQQVIELKTAQTKRKQVGEALGGSEQQFRALIENAQDAIVIVNPDVTIRYESPSMARMTGRKAEDRIGKNPFEYCHPDDAASVVEAFIQLLENKIPVVRTELRLQHKNGEWLTFEVIGTNLIDNPAVGGIVLNLREITER